MFVDVTWILVFDPIGTMYYYGKVSIRISIVSHMEVYSNIHNDIVQRLLKCEALSYRDKMSFRFEWPKAFGAVHCSITLTPVDATSNWVITTYVYNILDWTCLTDMSYALHTIESLTYAVCIVLNIIRNRRQTYIQVRKKVRIIKCIIWRQPIDISMLPVSATLPNITLHVLHITNQPSDQQNSKNTHRETWCIRQHRITSPINPTTLTKSFIWRRYIVRHPIRRISQNNVHAVYRE